MIEQVSLAGKTTIGTGGPAAYFVETASADAVSDALQFAAQNTLPVAAIGLGSNLLVADEGFPGVAIRLAGELATVSVEGTTLRAGGGASLAVCLHRARGAGLGGLEFACAIPGTVGGALWMNAGAYGSDVAAVLKRALILDATSIAWRSADELGLAYRRSSLQHGQVIVEAEFALAQSAEEEIRARVAEMQAARKASQPTNRRTFGSVFKNPRDDLGAGRAIDEAGLRGYQHGGAQISPKHANFIENAGAATTQDALALIRVARGRVRAEHGVELETEVQFLGPPAGHAPWPPPKLLAPAPPERGA